MSNLSAQALELKRVHDAGGWELVACWKAKPQHQHAAPIEPIAGVLVSVRTINHDPWVHLSGNFTTRLAMRPVEARALALALMAQAETASDAAHG